MRILCVPERPVYVPCGYVQIESGESVKQTLFLVVDGGGTKTVACLADMEGNILGVGRAAGSNALTVGQEQATASVMDAIGQAAEGADPGRIALCRLFIPGFSRCLPLPVPYDVQLLGDSPNAYFGALGEPNGIVLLAGTGSFAVSYDEQGNETTVGGWGPVLGDEGSGYDIARRAIRATLHGYDCGEAVTPLGRDVLAHYGIDSPAMLVHTVYHSGCDRKRMAQLCPVVGKHAGLGEPDAVRIMDDAARALCDMAVTLQRRCHLGACRAALTGGVAGLGEVIRRPLSRYLLREHIHLREPLYPPAVGGVLYTWWTLMKTMPDMALAERYNAAYKKETERLC